MALSIKSEEADRLAREVAAVTGESLTDAVTTALRERLHRVSGRDDDPYLIRDLTEIADRCAALPELDPRTPEEILGYDEHGLPR